MEANSGSAPETVRPLSPKEATEQRIEGIPPEVVACWNELIVKALRGDRALIKQEDAVRALMEAMQLPAAERGRVFSEGWLDIEPLFRAQGWDVKYDKPSYDEFRDPSWSFTAKRQQKRAP